MGGSRASDRPAVTALMRCESGSLGLLVGQAARSQVGTYDMCSRNAMAMEGCALKMALGHDAGLQNSRVTHRYASAQSEHRLFETRV